jgi:hypothetical protein
MECATRVKGARGRGTKRGEREKETVDRKVHVFASGVAARQDEGVT